jgi:hypothetical protein
LPAFVRVALFKNGEVAPLQKFRHGKAGNPAALEVGRSLADIWNRYVGRRGAGLPIVPSGISVNETKKLRRRLSFSLCMLPDSAKPEQHPILLKIIHLLKSYQHHVHNFIPDQTQPSLTTGSSRLTFSPRKTTGPIIRGSAIFLPLKFG